jgi:hypothetical protein
MSPETDPGNETSLDNSLTVAKDLQDPSITHLLKAQAYSPNQFQPLVTLFALFEHFRKRDS